jgi:uncharacterized protein (DUF1501 family)
MNRRTLLQALALGGGLSLLGSASAARERRTAARTAPQRGAGPKRVVLLLELRGGNDGLNTVAPFRDPLYRRARGALALEDGVPLGDDLLLHPALTPLRPAWQAGRLAFALGVGWPSPSRSHFHAADQWATGSLQGEGAGWLAQAMEQSRTPGPLVDLGPHGAPALEGGKPLVVTLSDGHRRRPGREWPGPERAGSHAVLRRMLELEQDAAQAVNQLTAALAPLPQGVALPRGGLGHQVGLALRLIGSDRCPPVIALSQDGYDTHAGQERRHHARLAELGAALAALERGLERLPRRPAVTLLTVSEFGRRLQVNGSGGTDHGSASVALLLGDRVPHPFLGRYPSLERLDERGDLIPSLAPPQLYRSVLAL